MTAHIDWKQVIETLRAKFHTVNLPKSFIAVNLSEKLPEEFSDAAQQGGDGDNADTNLTTEAIEDMGQKAQAAEDE